MYMPETGAIEWHIRKTLRGYSKGAEIHPSRNAGRKEKHSGQHS